MKTQARWCESTAVRREDRKLVERKGGREGGEEGGGRGRREEGGGRREEGGEAGGRRRGGEERGGSINKERWLAYVHEVSRASPSIQNADGHPVWTEYLNHCKKEVGWVW